MKKFFSVLLAAALLVCSLALPASASAVKDVSRDVNLTIYALEANDSSEVTVDSSVTGEQVTITGREPIPGVSFKLYRVADNETSTAVPTSEADFTTAKTGADGAVTVTIPAAQQGRYLVVENEKPDYCVGETVPFLVDLPMTSPDGADFIYDVYAYPKQEVTTDTDTEPIIPPPVTTDSDVPEEPKITKAVSCDGGKVYGDNASIDAINGSVATWKISVDIPKTVHLGDVFTVVDELDKRLTPPKANEVKVTVSGNPLPSDVYSVKIDGQVITVDFKNEKLEPYEGKKVDIIFDTVVEYDEDSTVGAVVDNIASLTYTKLASSSVSTDSDVPADSDTDSDDDGTVTTYTPPAEVWTGGIIGFKHDKNDKGLVGAEFTLYSDKACKNVIAKTTSDKNGNFSFMGLTDGTYYVVETKAPNGYQANSTIFEIKLDRETNNSFATLDVLNIPKTNLPLTGGIGTIGMTGGGCVIIALGAFMIFKALQTRKRYRATLTAA